MLAKLRALPDLPAETRVFIDANIFIYHFTGASLECTHFLTRCERGELWGITGMNTLLEVLHRLMMIEAVVKKLITPSNAAKKLRNKPQVVKRLVDYQKQVEAIPEMGIAILPLNVESFAASVRYRQEYGLMINDSITVALALSEGISTLVTSDQDFVRVTELTMYGPIDLGENG